MVIWIILSENQQIELKTEQINEYPFLKDTLLDIDIEPNTIFAVPFSADLLYIVFNNEYNQPLDLDKLVKVIQLITYLGLANEANQLLERLILYFKKKFTASQVQEIKSILNTLDSIMRQLFLSKISNLKTVYHSSYLLTTDKHHMDNINASIVQSSPDLDYTLVEHTFYMSGIRLDYGAIYSLWHKNNKVLAEIFQLSERYQTDPIDKNKVYISNDGTHYELWERREFSISTYNISPLPLDPKQPAISIIPIPHYTKSAINEVRISVDGSKYMFLYHPPPGEQHKHKMFIGSVAEPHKFVSFDIKIDYAISPVFDTIISIGSDVNYTIYHIENNQVFSKLINYINPGWLKDIHAIPHPIFYFSYDGKIIVEVGGNTVHILNAKGDLLVEKQMPQNEATIAITNKYLISYHLTAKELHLWSIAKLAETTNSSFIINVLWDRERYPDVGYTVHNIQVTVGQNNTFLLTREIIIREISYYYGDVIEKVFEWTKYDLSFYTKMDQFYESLVE